MTMLSLFGAVLGTALPGQVNVVRLRRAPAAAVVWNTQTHNAPGQAAFGILHTS